MLWKRALWVPILFWYAINPYLSADSYWYLTAAQAIRTNTWRENYVWNRTPGYPAFIAVMSWVSDRYLLEIVSLAQIVLVVWTLSKLQVQILKNQSDINRINQIRKAFRFSYVISFVLLGGYLTALLPQAIIAVSLTWQVILYLRIQSEDKMSLMSFIAFLFAVAISYLIHPILAISALISPLLHLTSRMIQHRTLKQEQLYKLGLAFLGGVSLFASVHLLWSEIAQENASIQVQRRKEQSFQTSNDSTVSSKKCDNPSESEIYVCDLLEKQQVLKRNALVTDPLFTQSIIRPILDNPISVISNMPKLFVVNMIGSPNHGPNVSIGFYRMFSGESQCVVAPTAVVLSASNGLLRNLNYGCKSAFVPLTSGILDSIFKTVYLVSWIIATGLLMRIALKILVRGLNGLIICFIPLAFIGVYTVLQSNENRYGAPALPLLLMFGSGLSDIRPQKSRNKKRVDL